MAFNFFFPLPFGGGLRGTEGEENSQSYQND